MPYLLSTGVYLSSLSARTPGFSRVRLGRKAATRANPPRGHGKGWLSLFSISLPAYEPFGFVGAATHFGSRIDFPSCFAPACLAPRLVPHDSTLPLPGLHSLSLAYFMCGRSTLPLPCRLVLSALSSDVQFSGTRQNRSRPG
jgi:hypothetical protein